MNKYLRMCMCVGWRLFGVQELLLRRNTIYSRLSQKSYSPSPHRPTHMQCGKICGFGVSELSVVYVVVYAMPWSSLT